MDFWGDRLEDAPPRPLLAREHVTEILGVAYVSAADNAIEQDQAK
jgi:hypothetical protein